MWLKLIIWYKRILLAFNILFTKGFKSLWTEVRKFLNKSLDSYQEIENIEEEIYDSKKKLMILVHTMEMGGVEKITSLLLKYIDKTSMKIELVMIFDKERFYEIPEDVKIYILERCPNQKYYSSNIALPRQLKQFSSDFIFLEMTALKLSYLIQKRKPSIVLAQDYYASIIASLTKKYLSSSVKLILSGHNDPNGLLATDKKGKLYEFLIRSLFNKVEAILTISNSLVKRLIDFGINHEKIKVLYNPVDIINIQKKAEDTVYESSWFYEDIPIILYVGRLASYKGLEFLLKAMSIVKKNRKIRCVIIGEGESRLDLQRFATDLNISDHVQFLGKVENPFKFMKRATIFCLPSFTEGFPNVLIESMACGCPIIATDSAGGGVAELLENGKYGLLVPTKDESALAEGILKLLNNDELRNQYIKLGQIRAMDFDIKKTIRAYEELIDSI